MKKWKEELLGRKQRRNFVDSQQHGEEEEGGGEREGKGGRGDVKEGEHEDRGKELGGQINKSECLLELKMKVN